MYRLRLVFYQMSRRSTSTFVVYGWGVEWNRGSSWYGGKWPPMAAVVQFPCEVLRVRRLTVDPRRRIRDVQVPCVRRCRLASSSRGSHHVVVVVPIAVEITTIRDVSVGGRRTATAYTPRRIAPAAASRGWRWTPWERNTTRRWWNRCPRVSWVWRKRLNLWSRVAPRGSSVPLHCRETRFKVPAAGCRDDVRSSNSNSRPTATRGTPITARHAPRRTSGTRGMRKVCSSRCRCDRI